MASRLDQIEWMLRAQLGDALMDRCPELTYNVNGVLVRFGRTADTLPALWQMLDSTLFNAVFAATGRTMLVTLPNGARHRVRGEQLRELSDRLLALCYTHRSVNPVLQDALFDLSRAGSFAAMRELCARYPLEEAERACILRVLEENGQTV